MYSFFLYAHIVSAMITIGPFFALLPIIRKLPLEANEQTSVMIELIRSIVRIIMHAGHVLVVTGIFLLVTSSWPWYSSWIIVTLFILLVSGVFLATGFTRVLKQLTTRGNHHVLIKRLTRTSWVYIFLMGSMLWLMVQKPIFW